MLETSEKSEVRIYFFLLGECSINIVITYCTNAIIRALNFAKTNFLLIIIISLKVSQIRILTLFGKFSIMDLIYLRF